MMDQMVVLAVVVSSLFVTWSKYLKTDKMGIRSTNPLQSFIDNFYRSGTDAMRADKGGL